MFVSNLRDHDGLPPTITRRSRNRRRGRPSWRWSQTCRTGWIVLLPFLCRTQITSDLLVPLHNCQVYNDNISAKIKGVTMYSIQDRGTRGRNGIEEIIAQALSDLDDLNDYKEISWTDWELSWWYFVFRLEDLELWQAPVWPVREFGPWVGCKEDKNQGIDPEFSWTAKRTRDYHSGPRAIIAWQGIWVQAPGEFRFVGRYRLSLTLILTRTTTTILPPKLRKLLSSQHIWKMNERKRLPTSKRTLPRRWRSWMTWMTTRRWTKACLEDVCINSGPMPSGHPKYNS